MEFNIFYLYIFLGILFVLLNKKISNLLYGLILYFTNKLNIEDLFIFRVDNENRNSMFFLMRSFTILFGISLILISFYFIYKLHF